MNDVEAQLRSTEESGDATAATQLGLLLAGQEMRPTPSLHFAAPMSAATRFAGSNASTPYMHVPGHVGLSGGS